MRGQQARRQARSTVGGACKCVQHQHPPAAPRRAGRAGGAGQSGTDHYAGRSRLLQHTGRSPRFEWLPARVEGCLQIVPLGRHARCFLHHKAARFQVVDHAARHRPGGQPRAAPAAARNGLERVQIPQVGVALRTEAVQIDGVGLKRLLPEHGLGVTNAQRQ